MYTPPANIVPSEQTVEVLSNHLLLDGLSNPAAWIFCPTRIQEQTLGYDGSLQNGKIVIIQYKRIRVNAGGSLRVAINPVQHNALQTNFPSGSVSYVFYGFSLYPNYRELDLDCQQHSASAFFAKMRFVDLHDIPPGCSSFSYSPKDGVCPSFNKKFQSSVSSIDGNQLVKGIVDCSYGMKFAEFVDLAGQTVSWRPVTPHTSILMLEAITDSATWV